MFSKIISISALPPQQRTGFLTTLIFIVFVGYLWRSILIFANGASSASSSKHISNLGQVCRLENFFCELKISKILKLQKTDLTQEAIFFVVVVVVCVVCLFIWRTISLLSFNCLCCKLNEIAPVTNLSDSIVLLSLTLFDIDFNFFKNIFSLRMNLYELIKKNNFQGFSLALIKR